MTAPDLLPCPFCGSEAECVEWEDGNYPTMSAQVQCNCGAKGRCCGANNRLGCTDAQNGLHRSKAIAAWNTRAPAEALAVPEVAALVTAVDSAFANVDAQIDDAGEFTSASWLALRHAVAGLWTLHPSPAALRAIGERADG